MGQLTFTRFWGRDSYKYADFTAVKTSALPTDSDVAYDFRYNHEPTAQSDAICVGLRGRGTYNADYNLVPNGHLIGIIGEARHEGTATADRFFAVEGRVDNMSTGTITHASGFEAVMGINNGSVGNFFGFHMVDHGSIPGVTNWYSLYSSGANAILFNQGDAIFGGNVGIGTSSMDSRLDLDDGAISFREMSAPSTPSADKVVIYADVNAGKTVLRAKFQDGSTVDIASQP